MTHYNHVCTLIFISLTVLLVRDSFACRYNVRETGFVAMESEQFFLGIYIDDHTSEQQVAEIKYTARDLFSESNIAFEIVNINTQTDHPALAYLPSLSVKTFPAAVLVSPDGQFLPVSLDGSDRPFADRLKSAFRQILFSAIREELKQKVSTHYGVVLFIEGRESKENQQAREAIEQALIRVKKNMDLMPKSIKNPPVMLTLKNKSLTADPVLIWTLGLKASAVEKPHAAVFYGKARWLGPLFKNEEITRNNLSEILFVIGADCECGLDKNWLRGTMLPMAYDKNDRERIAADLGFDPENPMIKSEIYHIMRTGNYRPERRETYGGLDTVSGYRKGITFASDSGAASAEEAYGDPPQSEESSMKDSFYVSTAILGFLLICGFFIVVRRVYLHKRSLQG